MIRKKKQELRENISTMLICPNCNNILNLNTEGVYKCFNCNFIIKRVPRDQTIQPEFDELGLA